jgi:hypothetical protein
MLETVDYKKSIKTLKINWVKTDYWGKYFFLFFWIAAIIISIVVFWDEPMVKILLPTTLFLSISSFVAIWSNDKLVEVSLNRPASDLKKLIKKEMEQTDWCVYRCNDQYLIADRYNKWLIGSKATILFYKDSAFINVQNIYGFRGYFPFSFGRNKRIAKTLIDIIQTSNAKEVV